MLQRFRLVATSYRCVLALDNLSRSTQTSGGGKNRTPMPRLLVARGCIPLESRIILLWSFTSFFSGSTKAHHPGLDFFFLTLTLIVYTFLAEKSSKRIDKPRAPFSLL